MQLSTLQFGLMNKRFGSTQLPTSAASWHPIYQNDMGLMPCKDGEFSHAEPSGDSSEPAVLDNFSHGEGIA